MSQLTKDDLILINSLSARQYTGKSLPTKSTEYERVQFVEIKKKLKGIALYFSNKYNAQYGPFIATVSPYSNPITRGNALSNVWSTFFKGAKNKQYAAQISFVIDKYEPFLHVGFYFGSASSRNLSVNERIQLEKSLSILGYDLKSALDLNDEIKLSYNSLFDLGFTAYSNGQFTLPDDWKNNLLTDVKHAHIRIKISPNDLGIIELSTLDFYVSQVVSLMSVFNQPVNVRQRQKNQTSYSRTTRKTSSTISTNRS